MALPSPLNWLKKGDVKNNLRMYSCIIYTTETGNVPNP